MRWIFFFFVFFFFLKFILGKSNKITKNQELVDKWHTLICGAWNGIGRMGQTILIHLCSMFGGDAKHPKVVQPRVSILFFYILPFTYRSYTKTKICNSFIESCLTFNVKSASQQNIIIIFFSSSHSCPSQLLGTPHRHMGSVTHSTLNGFRNFVIFFYD